MSAIIVTDQELENLTCTCPYHRYHVMHICMKHGRAFTHSQADCDDHRGCTCLTQPSSKWQHGDTTQTFVDRLYVLGIFGPWHELWGGSWFQQHWGNLVPDGLCPLPGRDDPAA